MNKRKFSIAGGIFLYSFIIIASWLMYSALRFDGIYSPTYVFGLSDPYAYYQRHIGALLLEHGKEYDMKTGIEEDDLRTYVNKEYKFRFKYPKEFSLVVNDRYHDNNMGILIDLSADKKVDAKCVIDIKYKGWGVGANWMPKKRKSLEWKINNNKEALYFYIKDRQVTYVNSTEISKAKDVGQFTGATYTDKKSSRAVDVTVYGKSCLSNNLAKEVLTTFELIQ